MVGSKRALTPYVRLALPVLGSIIVGMWAAGVLRDFARSATAADVDPQHYRAVPFQEKLRPLARLSGPAAALSGGAVAGLLTVALAGLACGWKRESAAPWLVRSFLGWAPLSWLALLGPIRGGLHTMGTRRLAVGIVGVALVGSWVFQLWLTQRRTVWKRLVAGRRWGLLVLTAVCHLLPLTLWASLVQWPTGDEPHYLLVVRSLVVDGDLDIRNNHANGEYHLFYEHDIGHAHAIVGKDGRWFSKHSPGLPLLAVPLYAAAGRWGVLLLMTVLASWFVVSLHRLMMDAGATAHRASCLGWWIMLSIPVVAYANQVFPAVPVGIAVAEACRLWIRRDGSDLSAVAVLVGLAAVPWLHLGSAQLAAPLLLFLWLRLGRPRSRLLRLAVGPCIVLGLLPLHYWATLGRLLPPLGAYGTYNVSQIPAVLLRLLADQEYGLLLYAPFWAGAAWGLGSVVRSRGWTIPVVIGGTYVVLVASWNWWYGGWAPVGRFLLPLLPVALVPLADRGPGVGLGERVLGGWAVLVGVLLTAYPPWRYNANDGSAALVDSIEGVLGYRLHRALPGGTTVGLVLAAVYVGGFLLASRIRSHRMGSQ